MAHRRDDGGPWQGRGRVQVAMAEPEGPTLGDGVLGGVEAPVEGGGVGRGGLGLGPDHRLGRRDGVELGHVIGVGGGGHRRGFDQADHHHGPPVLAERSTSPRGSSRSSGTSTRPDRRSASRSYVAPSPEHFARR